jgi:fructose-1,6-bisphosphatase
MPDHDSYRQFCEEINKRMLSNNEAFDKAILSLSSAGLALSLTFFKFVVPADEAVAISTLENGWYLFLGAIISTLISFIVSQQAQKKEIEHAEKYYLEDKEEYGNKNNPAANLTEALNILSGILFITALICIVSFVTKNI